MDKSRGTSNKASDLFLPAREFKQLLHYIEHIELDPKALSANVGLDLTKLAVKTPEDGVPAIYYSRLYLEMVKAMEERHPAVPWAAGMGTQTFRMLCYCIIHCKTLGEALRRAGDFHQAVCRLTGHQLSLSRTGDQAILTYAFDSATTSGNWVPPQGERTTDYETVTQCSGLHTWCSIISWLIGHRLQLDSAGIAGPPVSDQYYDVLKVLLGCPVEFDAETTAMYFPASQLEHPIVQTPASLDHFLGHALYQYWVEGPPTVNTTLAIKSLISGQVEYGLPRFEEIAERLHISTSTLRRRLMEENTSYQAIKDECREAAAIEHLHRGEMKIHEIGEMLGFSETSSFVRSFRKWTGMTPKAYRSESRELASN